MATKAFSQQRITDRFSQQKSAPGKKGKNLSAKQKVVHDTAVEVETADELIRKNDLDTLRHFDLDWRYGPCTGITRLERWERAESHGHQPPLDIKHLLLANQHDQQYAQNIWADYPL